MSIRNIKDGWLNYMVSKISDMSNRHGLSQSFVNEIEERSMICRSCPSLSVSSKAFLRSKCKSCGCSFPALVFAQSKKCPEGKWQEFLGAIYK